MADRSGPYSTVRITEVSVIRRAIIERFHCIDISTWLHYCLKVKVNHQWLFTGVWSIPRFGMCSVNCIIYNPIFPYWPYQRIISTGS